MKDKITPEHVQKALGESSREDGAWIATENPENDRELADTATALLGNKLGRNDGISR
jgi:hypothetical protein